MKVVIYEVRQVNHDAFMDDHEPESMLDDSVICSTLDEAKAFATESHEIWTDTEPPPLVWKEDSNEDRSSIVWTAKCNDTTDEYVIYRKVVEVREIA